MLGIDPSAGFIALARAQTNDARQLSIQARRARSRARASMPLGSQRPVIKLRAIGGVFSQMARAPTRSGTVHTMCGICRWHADHCACSGMRRSRAVGRARARRSRNVCGALGTPLAGQWSHPGIGSATTSTCRDIFSSVMTSGRRSWAGRPAAYFSTLTEDAPAL